MRPYYFLFLLAAPMLASCGFRDPLAGSDSDIVTNFTKCRLHPAQGRHSILQPWRNLPVRVVLDRNFYATDEQEQAKHIKGAIQRWNDWGKLKGLNIFTIVNDDQEAASGSNIPVTETCDLRSIMINQAQNVDIGIWKIEAGGDARNTRDVGGTQCNLLERDIQGLAAWNLSSNRIDKAAIILNFDTWNRPGVATFDLESIALHELGHALGLLHSCKISPGDQTSAPDCASASIRLFRTAVMFPSLGESTLRRNLRQNDYNRINCLY